MGFRCYRGLIFLVVGITLSSSLLSVKPQPMCHDQEKSALLRFSTSFLIDCDSTENRQADHPRIRPWLLKGGAETTSENCCEWDGVDCDHDTGHVTGLDLGNSCLYGAFPSNSTLFSLSHLQRLNLGINNFNYSQIPPEIGYLNKLTVLNLSRSCFSGGIPQEISKLSSLSLLDLAGNTDPVSGGPLLVLRDHSSIEKLVGSLTRLEELYLDQVDLQSSETDFLTNLASLRVISLRYCNLFSKFPSSLFHSPVLEVVNLAGNTELKGTLPEFRQDNRLRELRLYLTGFSGGLPPSIGRLGSLEVLNIWECRFSGTIPSTLGNLTQLTILNIAHNYFARHVTFSITNLTNLQYLALSGLELRHGDLATWSSKLNKLTALSLREMGLAGGFPSFVSNLTQLVHLDLSKDQISGFIPRWLGNLTRLTTLYLCGNQFKGVIPSEISQLTELEGLCLSYNRGLFGRLETFLKLDKLTELALSGVNLMLTATNYSTSTKFNSLYLDLCNLTDFPQFLCGQDELEVLSLSGNGIQGSIPQWFTNTARESLRILSLDANSLTRFEEPLVHLPWSSLEFLDLSGNDLKGRLPVPPSSMQSYTVAGNQFTGLVPEEICEAKSLKLLDLSNNKMDGRIPRCLGEQQQLLVLNLRGNNFSGTIPQTYSKPCKLKMINLSDNRLEGQLPRSLANCEMLEVLDVGRITINDRFPSWLGNLQKLQVLVLRHNEFYGRIPSPEAGFVFPMLRIIDLSNNHLIGELPNGYFPYWDVMKLSGGEDQSSTSGGTITVDLLTSGDPNAIDAGYNYSITITNKGNEMLYPKILNVFRVVDFSSNGFAGRIPDSIGSLQGLQALNLSNNNLQGGIPSSISNMSGLESLDLSQNMLSGGLPQQLSQLKFLEVLNVSHNDLVGPIPQGGQFDTFDRSSFDGNSGLCGSQLSEECGNIDSSSASPSSAPKDNQEQESKIIDWMIKLLGCGIGLIVGFVVGKCFITDKYDGWFAETFGGHKLRQRRRVRRTTRRRN